MNPPLELNFWLRFLRILALEVTLVVALAFVALPIRRAIGFIWKGSSLSRRTPFRSSRSKINDV
ncbi:MAG: hypothetical protein ABIV39_18010 [Verrucomicrobiota bacterium]